MGEEGEILATLEERTLRIRDTGPGLPEEIADTLFKPFGSARKRGGTGLGLAIARDLARAMGCELRLGETGEGGTTFELEFAEAPGWSGEAAAQ